MRAADRISPEDSNADRSEAIRTTSPVPALDRLRSGPRLHIGCEGDGIRGLWVGVDFDDGTATFDYTIEGLDPSDEERIVTAFLDENEFLDENDNADPAGGLPRRVAPCLTDARR